MACCVVETRTAQSDPVSINRQTAAECGKLWWRQLWAELRRAKFVVNFCDWIVCLLLLVNLRLMYSKVFLLFVANKPTVKLMWITNNKEIHYFLYINTVSLWALANWARFTSTNTPLLCPFWISRELLRYCQDGDSRYHPLWASFWLFRNLWVTSQWLCPLSYPVCGRLRQFFSLLMGDCSLCYVVMRLPLLWIGTW